MQKFKLDFGSVHEEFAYWSHEARSEPLPELLERTDAILAFRGRKADLLRPVGGKWQGFQLRDLYGIHREHVRALTLRTHALLLNATVA